MPDLKFSETNVLIDEKHSHKILGYYHGDTKFQLQKNIKQVDEKYLKKEIEYKFNAQGYRTKDFDELEKDFVLIFGCSHTEGVGNFFDDIWCSQLCKQKGIDFLNLAKAGTGADIQYLNTLQYLKNRYPLPRCVIYQWPQSFRRSFCYMQDNDLVLKHHNINNKTEQKDTKWFLKRYCVESGEMSLDNYVSFNSSNVLWDLFEVPVLNWTWEGDFDSDRMKQDLIVVKTEDTGRARDMMHDGVGIHTQVKDQLSAHIDKLL